MHLDNVDEVLQRQALLDLTDRAKGGVFLYLLVWLVIGIAFQLSANSPDFFYFNCVVFSLIAVLRGAHYLWVTKSSKLSPRLMQNCLVLLVTVAGVHWGSVVAWILYHPDYVEIRNIALIVTPGFAIAGTAALSISNKIRVMYPIAMYLPCLIVLFLMDGQENRALAYLSFVSMFYVYITTGKIRTDYWSALRGRFDAEKRADLMEEISTTDPLTGIKNRMYFDKIFNSEWKRCSRLNSPISLLMIDLDYFKSINDTYGHVFGDQYLIEVTRALSANIQREGDCLARYGGEEFIILLPDVDAASAKEVADRLILAISNVRLNFQSEIVSLTCSIGGSTMIPSQNKKIDYLLKKADVALYRAKDNGRNQYCEFILENIE